MKEKMSKAEMRAYVDARARDLAASGKYHNSGEIEHVLRFAEGVEDAHEMLDRKWFRDYLDQLCRSAHHRLKHQREDEGEARQ